MENQLEEQVTNELRALLQQLNLKYNDFFHFNLLTIVDMEQAESCDNCKSSETGTRCLRAVVGYDCRKPD